MGLAGESVLGARLARGLSRLTLDTSRSARLDTIQKSGPKVLVGRMGLSGGERYD